MNRNTRLKMVGLYDIISKFLGWFFIEEITKLWLITVATDSENNNNNTRFIIETI